MYSRQFLEPPVQIVKNGKAVFGTFTRVSPKIDIRGMRAPYAGIPLPSFLSNLRIKSRLYYVFSTEQYFGFVQFFDFKALGLAEIALWNKANGRKYIYHSLMPTRRRFIPVLTKRGICSTFMKRRYIKISWGKQHQHHALSFKVRGDSARPDAEGFLTSPLQDSFHSDTMFVCPSPAGSRCSATWYSTMSIDAHLTVKNEQPDNSPGLAAMHLNRTYFKMRSHTTMGFGIGTVKEHKLSFQIKSSNLDAADSDTYNDNVLVLDGEPTALPPVYITHPFGTDKNWIIQDTESMIDLTFTPLSVTRRTLDIIALRTTTTEIYGTFEGNLLTKDGEKLVLKAFPGIIYKNFLRI